MTQVGCDSYCEHGAVCALYEGHDGEHDSNFCQWTDETAISREEANAIYLASGDPLAPLIIELRDIGNARIRQLEAQLEADGSDDPSGSNQASTSAASE